MTIARISASFSDFGLGLARTLALPLAFLGCSSAGDVNTPTLVLDPSTLADEFGQGPGVSACAKALREAGGPLLFVRAETGTAGQLGGYREDGLGTAAAGTLSAAGGNSSTAIPALTGTPVASYALRVRVTTAGSNIAASPVQQISLDGGLTWLAAGAVAVSATPQAIGSTGLLIGWTDGSFVLSDAWSAYGAACPTPKQATGGSVLTLSGTPVDRFDVQVKVTRAAATAGDGTGAIRYSLDGGETFAPELPVPTSRAVVLGDSGVTVTFSAASLVADEIYSFSTTAPVFSADTMEAALLALEAVGTPDHEGVIVVGPIDATYFDEITDSHNRLLARSRPRWFLTHARDQGATLQGETSSTWATALLGATPGFSGQNAKLVATCAGAAQVTDAMHGGAVLRRSVLFALASRLAAIDVAEHPGRQRSGSLSLELLYHDLADDTLDALDSAGFIGAQSIDGAEGYYATDATRAPTGSDFGNIMNVRVMCFAARVALARMVEEVNESPDVNNDGTLRSDVADGLDAAVTTYLERELGARVTSASVRVSRTQNVLTTGQIPYKIRLVPRAYGREISLDLGFTISRS